MNTQPIIEVKHISKSYQIRHQAGGYVTLRDIIAENLRHPLRFLKGKAKKVLGRESQETFWALKDVNFTVDRGETIGIIGANGSGKSTILKILSQITPPTDGEITIRGTVASLLEVGTGFHPELTGRENIFLNGAILGMKRADIATRFEEIVAFAGVERFLDTQVKYYSSGMYVRLAFAVAAHMDPDILIIDEVLAVGDAEFQKKCLGKIEEVTKSEGRTVLFVSHNLAAVQSLCKRCVLLEKGVVKMVGETSDVIDKYLESNKGLEAVTEYPINEKLDAQILKVSIVNKDKVAQAQIPLDEKFFIEMEYVVRRPVTDALTSVIFTSNDVMMLLSTEEDKNPKLHSYEPGSYKTSVEVPAHLFNAGQYSFEVSIQKPYIERIDMISGINFEISDIENSKTKLFKGKVLGKLSTILNYETEKTH